MSNFKAAMIEAKFWHDRSIEETSNVANRLKLAETAATYATIALAYRAERLENEDNGK
jgi:hypothetical protein